MRRLPALGLLTGLLLFPLSISAETLGEMESRLDLRQSSDQGQATFVGKSARLTAWQQMENLKAGKGWGIVREKDKGGSAGWLAKPMHDGAVVASFPNSQDTAYVWLKPAGAATFLAHRTNGSRLEDGIATPYVSLRAQRYGIDSQYMPYVVLGTHAAPADEAADVDFVDARSNQVLLTVPKVKAGTRPLYKYDALAFEHGDAQGGFSLVVTGISDMFRAQYRMKAVPGRYRTLHLDSNIVYAEDMDGNTVVFTRLWAPFAPDGMTFSKLVPLLERQGKGSDETIYKAEAKAANGRRGWLVLHASTQGRVSVETIPRHRVDHIPVKAPGARGGLQGGPWRDIRSEGKVMFGQRDDGLWEAFTLQVSYVQGGDCYLHTMIYKEGRHAAVAASPEALKADLEAGRVVTL